MASTSSLTHHVTPACNNKTPTSSSPFLPSKLYKNLASYADGARILFATDEWFATAENLLNDDSPTFVRDLYCEQGKVMDGWESRRRRESGHDWAIVKLAPTAAGGGIYGVEIDTAYFTGNQTPRISLSVCTYEGGEEEAYCCIPGAIQRLAQGGGIRGTSTSLTMTTLVEKACKDMGPWTQILPVTPLRPGYEETRMHYFILPKHIQDIPHTFTHLRINYYPDGGVARLRLWSRVTVPDTPTATVSRKLAGSTLQPNNNGHPLLSCATNGAIALRCSNAHYGHPSNLILPTLGKNMGDGWETARHPNRPPIIIKNPTTNLVESDLMDWAIIKLGLGGGKVSRIIIDTSHFKGNYPESVMVEGCCCYCHPTTTDNKSNNNNVCYDDEVICAASATTSLPNSNSTVDWFPLLLRTRMGPDAEHVFDRREQQTTIVNGDRIVTHLRICIYPDGGLSRIRMYGEPVTDHIALRSHL